MSPVVHVTAESRAAELPDEFIVKYHKLYCKWCNKVIHSLRKDNIVEHLHSKLHQDNRMEKGAPMSFDPMSPKIRRTKENRRNARERKQQNTSFGMKNPSSEYQGTATESEEEEDLQHIFEESDSEGSELFEGFDESAVFEVTPKKRDIRTRKRPAKLTDASDSNSTLRSPPAKRSKGSSSDALSPQSPFSIKSLPLKKQISYSAKVSNTSSSAKSAKKGALKIKISRKSREKSKSFHVESSETEDTEKAGRRRSTPAGHGGLKMKFVIKNLGSKDTNALKRGRKLVKTKKKRRRKSAPAKATSYDDDSTDVQESPYTDPDPPGVEDVDEELEEQQVIGNEVVEEEIVGVDEGEVVSWEDIAADEEDNFDDVPDSPLPVEEITAEENLARKADHARQMAKSVNSAQFKKKRLTAAAKKRQLAKQDDKDKKQRKASGYMLWSSKMRKQVATQFPGLQFGDVSKKLGDLWKRIPDKEKQMWKYRSVKMATQLEKMQRVPQKRKQGSRMIETGPRKKQAVASPRTPQFRDAPLAPYPPHRNPEQTMKRELAKLPAPSIEPIDAAAHFHLLGESLVAIGRKVHNSGSGASMAGVIPTLLDSFLCALAPLVSLTNQVPQLQGAIPDSTMSETLANIAHFIPSTSQSLRV